MFKSRAGLLVIMFIMVVTPLLNSCGKEDVSASFTTSKAGPTSSGYYFNLTLSPSIVTENGTINLSVRVWDTNGNIAAGVNVNFSGSSKDGAEVLTDQWGYSETVLLTTGLAGTVGSITATVQDLGVIAPYQILPETGYE